jgi:hypothetical protein
MQIKKLFNLLQDVQDVLSLFENVTSTAQMVSCLERMKRGQAPEDFYNTIQSLRVSLTEAFDDQLELGGNLSDSPSEDEETFTDDLLKETDWENQGDETTEEPSDLPTVVTPQDEKPNT